MAAEPKGPAIGGQNAKTEKRHAIIPKTSSSPRRRGPITTSVCEFAQVLQRLRSSRQDMAYGSPPSRGRRKSLPVLTRRPEHVSRALVVGVAARDEQEVGKTVD